MLISKGVARTDKAQKLPQYLAIPPADHLLAKIENNSDYHSQGLVTEVQSVFVKVRDARIHDLGLGDVALVCFSN